jgi:hypothetical protein
MSDGKMVNMSEESVSQHTPTISKEELAPGIVVYKDVIPGHQQLIPYVEHTVGSGMANWDTIKFLGKENQGMTFPFWSEYKDPNDFSISFEERMSLVFSGYIGVVEQDYLKTNNLPHKNHSKFVLQKTEKGVSFLLDPKKIKDFSSVIVFYFLNNDYSGGSIEFLDIGITYYPKENEVLFIPSVEDYAYGISEILSGTKYSVSTWLLIPSEGP